MISIITVGMNYKRYIEELYHSLYVDNKPEAEFEAIFVDNCSTDDSVAFLRENYPQVKIVHNDVPLGFGENNNKGVQASIGDIVAIINPDIIFQGNCLDVINQQFLSCGSEAIYAPQLLNPDKSVQFSIRSFITLRMFVRRLWSRGDDSNMSDEMVRYLCKDIDTDRIQTVDWAMGAALVMKRETYDQLGGFDQSYFLYMEDEDLCLRAWKKHIPVIYLPASKMIHNHLRGSSKLGKKTLMHFKSMFTFFKHHGLSVRSYKKDVKVEDYIGG